MIKPTILLITGYAGSGKNTVASLLNLKLQGVVIENATNVKILATEFFKWNSQKDIKGRELLVNITNSGYSYDKYFWEKKTESTIKQLNSNYVIIPDWRYVSTYEYFKLQGYDVRTLRVLRASNISIPNSTITNSEKGLDDYTTDYIIRNHSSLDDLIVTIDDFLRINKF